MPLRKIAKKTILTDEREKNIHFFFRSKRKSFSMGWKRFSFLFICLFVPNECSMLKGAKKNHEFRRVHYVEWIEALTTYWTSPNETKYLGQKRKKRVQHWKQNRAGKTTFLIFRQKVCVRVAQYQSVRDTKGRKTTLSHSFFSFTNELLTTIQKESEKICFSNDSNAPAAESLKYFPVPIQLWL